MWNLASLVASVVEQPALRLRLVVKHPDSHRETLVVRPFGLSRDPYIGYAVLLYYDATGRIVPLPESWLVMEEVGVE